MVAWYRWYSEGGDGGMVQVLVEVVVTVVLHKYLVHGDDTIGFGRWRPEHCDLASPQFRRGHIYRSTRS